MKNSKISHFDVGDVQVETAHYDFDKYVTKERWASYREQVKAIMASQPSTALYVGVGDNIVPKILELCGATVSRFDFDERLGVDYSGDVRQIGGLVGAKTFDVVACCQILEHIPFEDFDLALSGIFSVARRRVVISLPYCHKHIGGISIQFPRVGRLSLELWIPCFWRAWRFDGEHHWEVGAKGYSLRSITDRVAKHGRIAERFFVSGNHYHVFFIVDCP